MKQYLMMCDEGGMNLLKQVFKGESIQFLEVQGMGLNGAQQHSILVTPILPPVTPMPMPAMPQQQVSGDVQPEETPIV